MRLNLQDGRRAIHLSSGRLVTFYGPFPAYGERPPINGVEISELSSPPLTPAELRELAEEFRGLADELDYPGGIRTPKMGE